MIFKGDIVMKKKKENNKNKLLTIACLCSIACAFTLVSVNTVKNTKMKQEAIRTNEQITAKYEIDKQIKENNEMLLDYENKMVSENINAQEESTLPENSITLNENPIKEASVPVSNGKIIAEYTDTVLVFNEMYGDYRTHNGVDISAPLNSAVMSVKKGIVVKNEFDYEEGYIVEIEHDDGVVSVYKNLDSDKIVKVGQVVNAGDTIGTIGKSGVFESNLEPHLHFEIREEDIEINPEEYMKITE